MPEICLHCRKSFKKPRATPACPECGGSTHRVHSNFRAPRTSAERDWELVAFLVHRGYDFSGWVRPRGGSDAILERPGYPKNLREADEFVQLWVPLADPEAPTEF